MGVVARASMLFLAGALALCGCRRTPAPDPAPSGTSAPSGPGAPSTSAGVGAEALPPLTLRGSNVALTPDGSTLVVADEDHEVLYLVPTTLAKAPEALVVPLPGPPAQLVVLGERVLVTVRTLPTAASRRARDAIRGPLPLAAKMAALPGVAASAAPSASAPPTVQRPSKPSPSKAAASAALASASPSASATPARQKSALEHAKTRPRNTPPAIFDPALVRQSEGGLLLVLGRNPAKGLVELGRAVLPPDAWGLAVTPDGKRAVVTSAWSATVSLVDLASLRVVAKLATRREPRGIAITPDGKLAYLSHLTGRALTELTLGDTTLEARELDLPPAPARTPLGATLEASLGYDLVLSPDAESLFVPRHALGAEGVASWWGAPTVDVLDRASGQPVAPFRGAPLATRIVSEAVRPPSDWEASPGQAPSPELDLVQPRSVVYRKSRDTLLVTGEGADALSELDALSADPAMAHVKRFALGGAYDVFGDFPDRCGAPSGVALARDERVAYVYCRTTFDVARVELDTGALEFLHLAEDGLPADAAYGRRLFTNAKSEALSGGLGCAACHPEGRDDGYVWREGQVAFADGDPRFLGRRENMKRRQPGDQPPAVASPGMHPRQTPMLAGRVRANGPFGWHAESKDIVERLILGMKLHRAGWHTNYTSTREIGQDMAKIDYLADYLRSGLLPPPTLVPKLGELEERGKVIFESEEARCSRCHVPASEFTDRAPTPLGALPAKPGFDREANTAFKTPSLLFVAGTAPYFHDGSQATLEELLRTNRDRMGKTSHLAAGDQAALAAYLRTL